MVSRKPSKFLKMNLGNQKQTNKQTDAFLPFISTFNPNSPSVYHAMRNSIEIFKRNNVPGFESIKSYKQ